MLNMILFHLVTYEGDRKIPLVIGASRGRMKENCNLDDEEVKSLYNSNFVKLCVKLQNDNIKDIEYVKLIANEIATAHILIANLITREQIGNVKI